MTTSQPVACLKTEGVTKRFGNMLALDNVSLEAFAGEVVAIVGENGSGKSTLVKILAGSLEADGGQTWLNGRAFKPKDPSEALRLGVGSVAQEDTICPELTAAENVLLGNEIEGRKAHVWDFLWQKSTNERAQHALEDICLGTIDIGKPAELLSGGQKKSVVIARALLSKPSVLILDEPTNSLGMAEQTRLFKLVQKLKANGLCILYISHKPSEVMEVADKVLGLKQGRIVQTLKRGDFDEARLTRLMMGL